MCIEIHTLYNYVIYINKEVQYVNVRCYIYEGCMIGKAKLYSFIFQRFV